ncbi:MAG: autotransporter-associated beta strand repeat-containing protein [Thermoguttaceae bacterium]|nr:autotransporter-associated beta strand repeat-containing protein [Thermoguttaceae bacterium]
MCATVNKQHIRNSRALASFGAALSVLLGTAVPVSADLVAYWTFNDHADGTLLSATQDSSGNGYTVTNVGTASYAPHISDTDPLYGNHLARDGATVESKSNCNITSAGVYSNNMTISFWGTQPTTNWRNYLTLRTGSTGEELQFQKANNGLVVYKSNNKNQNAINMVGSSTLDLGSDWHHFVVTVDSAAQKAYMYVDGELINEKEWTHAEQITDLTFNGAWSFGGRGSDADLDEVQIYDQAMTAEQVKYLYNNPSLYHAAVYQRNVSGSGNWSDALWDANGLTGQTFANSSAVKLTASNSPTLTLDQAVTVNSLDFNGSMTIGGTNTLTFNGEKRITVANAADTATISTPINALYDNGLTKTGAGTLTLNNNQSTFTGNVVVNGGTLIASASWKYVDTTVFGDYVSKTVTVNDGAELVFAAQDVVSNSGTNSPIRFIANGGTIRNSGTVYNNLSNTEFTDGAQLYAADGNATWKAYKLSSKVSVLRNTDGSAAQPVTFSSDLTKANATYSFGNGTSIYVEDITSSSGAADANADLIVSALVTNPNQESNGTFHKDGAGILEFTAANTFNGTASIREGVLRLSGNGALGTSTVTLGDKGTLELNVADGAEKTFTNKVTGAGKVAKTGAGTLKLNTANGFETSSLNVSAGRANVVGTLSGDLAIADGASFSPGDGIGTLTVNGLFSADDGARLVFELGVDASDLLILGSGSTLDIADDAVIELLFADADPDKAYTLIQAEDGLGEYTDSAFWTNLLTAASDANWDLSVVGNTLQAIAGSGTIDPSDPSVPEPAAWVLLVLGAAGLFIVRQKRV